MAQYQWKKDGPKPKVEAQVFGETVEKIAGDLTSAKPEDIVEAARNKRSPIHEMFEWQDDKAAELYWRQQARHFVGALQLVRVEFSEGQTISDRAFFSVRADKRTGYVERDRILSDRDLKKQVLEAARKELESYIRKFGGVMALGTFVQRLQEIIDDMQDNADSIVFDASRRRSPVAEEGIEESPATAPA